MTLFKTITTTFAEGVPKTHLEKEVMEKEVIDPVLIKLCKKVVGGSRGEGSEL